MANIQVVRIERRPQLGGPLLAHIDGRRRPAEAKTREGMPACIKIAGDVEAARQALKAAQAVKRPGPKPAPVVEGLFAGPPPFESPDAWTLERGLEWGEANVEWFQQRAGSTTVIAAAYLHLDEKSLHMHLLAIPIDERGRLGWKRIEEQFALDPTARGSRIMSSLQDAYQHDVGERFGLGRGEVGSGRKHERINRRRGLVERVLDGVDFTTKQKLEASRLDAADARTARDRAIEGRERAERDRDHALSERAAAVEAEARAQADRTRAVEAHDQAVARAEAVESERDELKHKRTALLREGDAARKARDEAHQALDREREGRNADTADWRNKLQKTVNVLLLYRKQRDETVLEFENLYNAKAPTRVEIDAARERARAADAERVRAEAERDKAQLGWNHAHQGYVAEKCEREQVVATRDGDVAAARNGAYSKGRVSRDSEVAAAIERADGLQATVDDLQTSVGGRVMAARAEGLEAGRAERADEVEQLTISHRGEVEQLTMELDTVTRARDQNEDAGKLKTVTKKLKDVTEDRDYLWKQLTELPKPAVPHRPRLAGEQRPAQKPSRSGLGR